MINLTSARSQANATAFKIKIRHLYSTSSLKHSEWHLLMTDHRFTCHPHAYPGMEWTTFGWLHGTVAKRRSFAGKLSLSCARPV